MCIPDSDVVVGMAMLVQTAVSQNIKWIAIDFGKDIRASRRINLNTFGDYQMFHLAPLWALTFVVFEQIIITTFEGSLWNLKQKCMPDL